MKIAIVGTGAMGSVYAALLGAASHEIWAIDAWQAHVDTMRANGLRLEGASGDRTVRLHATTDAKEVGPCDLVIIATKVMHVAQAAEATKALLGKDTLVLSIQNGLGGPDTAARVLGRERVLVGVVGGFGASMKGPGHAHHNGWELVRLGEFAGLVSPRLEKIAEVWRSGGFKVKCFDDIDQLVWEKLICNVCYSGTCAITEPSSR
jgi:2-dehydropantoate 2-reductase